MNYEWNSQTELVLHDSQIKFPWRVFNFDLLFCLFVCTQCIWLVTSFVDQTKPQQAQNKNVLLFKTYIHRYCYFRTCMVRQDLPMKTL